MPDFEIEEFWDDLLSLIEMGRVIPVIGPEVLTLESGVPLYGLIAEKLLRRYQIKTTAGVAHGLFESVSTIAEKPGVRTPELYRAVHNITRDVLAQEDLDLEPLHALGSIRHFNFFVSTTPDDLLVRTLESVRGTPVDEIVFAPKLPTERMRDIPELPGSRYSAVFYFFGKLDVQAFYAIHDEDALEFSYQFQSGGGPEHTLSQIRTKSLLLIGCTFGRWLGRFFLRLSNTERLASPQRMKKEYLVGQETNDDHDLVLFLRRFSQESRCYPPAQRLSYRSCKSAG